MADFNASDKFMDFEKGFTIDFNLENSLSSMVPTSKRLLSKVKGMFLDPAAADAEIEKTATASCTNFTNFPLPTMRAIWPLA